ncbi:MAG: F0F1 ATP synthase subunit delta [Verrucomicrobiales bacterium]|nr:F0F1 ATP synthase subunit delta [Verrucomicrobiales bacterium]
MKSGKELKRIAKKLFQASLVDGVLDPETVQKVVRKLSDAKPRGYLQVVTAYWRLVRLEIQRNSAVIESAIELDVATKNQVEGDLKKKYGDQVTAEYAIRPELLGGIRIKIGSDVWDGSVKNRIQRLEEKFN